MNTKRTHRLLSLAIALVMALSLLPTKAWGYNDLQGSGTEVSPYLISNAQALESLAKQVNDGTLKTEGVYFRQTADIDLSGFKNNSWVPIGNITGSGGSTNRTFDGIYDGNGFRIKNFVFEDTTRKYYGLFGLLSESAVIKNLTLDKSCSVTARTYVGGLVSRAAGAALINCTSYATVYAAGSAGEIPYPRVGGLAAEGHTFINCTNYGSVKANPDSSGFSSPGGYGAGGIACIARVMIGCANYGSVVAGGQAGGVVGEISCYGSTEEKPVGVMVGCANYGTVEAREWAGGLAGDAEGIMEDCYNLGTVKVERTQVGGLVGKYSTSTYYALQVGIHNCYHAGSVQYGAEEAEPVAGHLVGQLSGRADEATAKAYLSGNYYQNIGLLPAVGSMDIGDSAVAMELADMQKQEFLDKLNSYTHVALYGAAWQFRYIAGQGRMPVYKEYQELLDYSCKLKGVTVNGMPAIAADGGYTWVLPYGTDLTKVSVVTSISPRAAVEPADGTLDFSKGPVTFTVTAQDGVHRQSYPVTVTAAASPDGLSALRVKMKSTGDVTRDDYLHGLTLVGPEDFQQDVTTRDYTVYDYNAAQRGAFDTNSWNGYYFWAVPAETGATMVAATPTRTSTITACADMMAKSDQYVYYGDSMHLGDNTTTLTVTPPSGGSGKETVYTFHVKVLPSLGSVSFSDSGTEMAETFHPLTFAYSIKVPDYLTGLTPTVTTTLDEGETVTYSPALEDGKIPLDKLTDGKFTITVSDAEDSTLSTTYTFTVEQVATFTARIVTNVADAHIRVYQGTDLMTPNAGGAYELRGDRDYRFEAAAKGYVSVSDALTEDLLSDGVLELYLEEVPTGDLPRYDSSWPSFRGNDENMAITTVRTPIGPYAEEDDVELLWNSTSGSGFDSGAVGCPIFVDGYMYAYAGTNILKLDPATGETLISKPMEDASDFAIIPPTYGDGMIFVGLKNGRVQAFRADTLESLWVYTDPLGGQSNSPITYSDGCVYVGFWRGESGAANFVCLTADDENPNRKTEPKIPLWSCTNDGGFYWAGAYANDKYVMVTTDDGYSGYSHNTGKLLIFDKRTGELTDSKTTYTGDLRSNVAYDKASGRIFFTSKGGAMYSEIVGADGKIDRSASKTVALGGMSTSTPVVCNGRAYVGVAGTGGQFTPYGGHHIAVIDLTDWKVAYTAQTQGYPQTSGLMTTGYDDGVYVYFMDNYTPGVMRVIHDAPGQTALEGGVTEEFTSDKGVSGTYTDCAPVVFTPRGSLAQYCIGSPVTDEYGTLYFKNDSGNLIALTSAVRELKVAEKPEIARTEDGQWEVTGGKIVAVLANGLERDITALVEYRDDGSGGVEAVYTYGTSVQPYTKSVRTVSLNGASAAQPGIGNGAEEGVTENGVTSFKAGTSAGAPEIRVTAPANGWAAGENIFTVASDGDAACTVMVKKADGTLVRLTASTADGTHSFTAVLAEGDSLVVGLKGDVNGDGEITSGDIVQAQAGFLGKLTLQDHRQLCGAVFGGDAIGSRDIVQIRAASLGKLTLKW